MPRSTGSAELLQKILVPLDGSRLGESAVGYVERAADPSRTEIILLQVVAPVGVGKVIREGESSAYRGHALRRMRAERYLETLRKRLGRRGLRARAVVRSGDPAEEILDCAAAERVTLIAMSTHGRTGLRRVLFGSVAEAVLRKSSLPILLARAGAGQGTAKKPS